jgi:hypothetical protein
MFYDSWDENLIEALAEPFAPSDHKTKKQGGQEITFVDVHRYKERLNATVGPHGWSSTLRLEPIGGKLIATVALTVLGVTKENVGDEVEVPEVNERGNEKIIGGPATNSYAQAFKRAASDFGLGAYLYDKAKRDAATKATGYTSQPRASNGNGNAAPAAATIKQLEFAENLLKSTLFTDEERTAVQQSIAKNPTRSNVSRAIERMQAQIKEREPVGV